jgi:hypothetical protein
METVRRGGRQDAARAQARRADYSHPAERPPYSGHDVVCRVHGFCVAGGEFAGQRRAGHRSPVSDQLTKEEISWHESS